MTKLIAALIIAAVLFAGWELFVYWDKVEHEDLEAKKRAQAAVVVPEQLPGLPSQLENSLQAVRQRGAPAFKAWLKTYGPSLQDPRKAWIELDYCVLITRDDPAEARRIFADVKKRTPAASPIWPRIKQLEKTYE